MWDTVPMTPSANSSPHALVVGHEGASTDHDAMWQPANTGITLPLHIQGNPVTL